MDRGVDWEWVVGCGIVVDGKGFSEGLVWVCEVDMRLIEEGWVVEGVVDGVG